MADPVRLRDARSSATKELRELLAAGRSEMPDPGRLRGVARRLGYPASAVPGGAKLLAKTGAGGSALAGATKIGALVLVLGAGAGVLAMRERTTVPVSSVAPPAATTVAESAPSTTQPVDVAPAQAPAPSASWVAIPKPGARARAPTRPAVAGPAQSTAGSTSARETPTPSSASVGASPPATWGSSAPLTPDAPGEMASPAPVGRIEEAQRELARNPSHALYLALRDQRISGDLVEERELVIIEALLRLGRLDEARERAARFLRTFPASSHREEVAAPFGFDPGSQNP